MEEEIRGEFLLGLLDVLEVYNASAETEGEKQLMHTIVSTLHENLEFTD
ncbi:MAG: hypothetical protein K0R00_3177 [Herbinix sp.]|nr:hypothetical protein [Herbinix sp.]